MNDAYNDFSVGLLTFLHFFKNVRKKANCKNWFDSDNSRN